MTKVLTPKETSNMQSDNAIMPQKSSTTQRLRTNLEQSVGVITATQQAWLNRLTGSQPSQSQQQ